MKRSAYGDTQQGLEAGKSKELQLYGDFLEGNTTRKKCKNCVPRHLLETSIVADNDQPAKIELL